MSEHHEHQIEAALRDLLAPPSDGVRRQRVLGMISDNIRYREALRFYADGRHFSMPKATNDNRPRLWDEGETAQRVLDGGSV